MGCGGVEKVPVTANLTLATAAMHLPSLRGTRSPGGQPARACKAAKGTSLCAIPLATPRAVLSHAQWVSESSRAYAAVTRVVTDENEPRAAASTAGTGCHPVDTGILLRAAHYYPMHPRAVEEGGNVWETTSRAAYGPRGAVVPVTRGRPAPPVPSSTSSPACTALTTTAPSAAVEALGMDVVAPAARGEAQVCFVGVC